MCIFLFCEGRGGEVYFFQSPSVHGGAMIGWTDTNKGSPRDSHMGFRVQGWTPT